MKKIAFILIACLLTAAVSAQSIHLFHNGQPLNNGDEVLMSIIPGTVTHAYVEYSNVTDEDVFVRVKRENISFVEGDALTFCVGGSCSENLSGEFLVMSGYTATVADSTMVFHADYSAPATHGTEGSRVKFTFYNTDDESDAVSFYLVASPGVGVQQYETARLVSAYPNPATSVVNIRYNVGNASGSQLVIRNVLGGEMYREPVQGEGKSVISTANMAPGIYVYGLEENGRMHSVHKLVVK